jgi:hypothetical protein
MAVVYTPPGLTAEPDNDRFRWQWRAPCGKRYLSPKSYATARVALSEGRRWLSMRPGR